MFNNSLCNNNQATTNSNFIPDPCNTGCLELVKGECVTYTGATTACMEITSGTKLNDIINAMDQAICLVSEDKFSDYDLGCLSSLNIENEENFAEEIAELLCKILGNEDINNPINLTQLKTDLAVVTGIVNSQAVLTCFQALGSLPSSTTLVNLLSAIQTVICAYDLRLDNLESNPSLGGKVKVTSADTTANFLAEKIVPGDMIDINILNVGADEDLEIEFDFSEFLTFLTNNPAEAFALNLILNNATTTTTTTTTTTSSTTTTTTL